MYIHKSLPDILYFALSKSIATQEITSQWQLDVLSFLKKQEKWSKKGESERVRGRGFIQVYRTYATGSLHLIPPISGHTDIN